MLAYSLLSNMPLKTETYIEDSSKQFDNRHCNEFFVTPERNKRSCYQSDT